MRYECALCGDFSSERFYIYFKHISNRHRADPNFNLFCTVQGCSKQYISYSAYKSHIYRQHHKLTVHESKQSSEQVLGESDNETKFVLRCALCFDESSKTLKDLTSHLTVHLKSGTVVTCPFQNCGCEYRTPSSFKTHISRKHREIMLGIADLHHLVTDNILNPTYLSSEIINNQEMQPEFSSGNIEDEVDLNVIDDGIDFEEAYLKSLSFSILKLQEMSYLPVTTVDSIICELSSINDQTMDFVQNRINSILVEENVDPFIRDKLKKCLDENIFVSSIGHLKTDYLRNKHWKSTLRYVEPQLIRLEVDDTHRDQNYQYIPLLESLKSLLSIEEVLTEVMNPLLQPNPDILLDYNHGCYFKENKLFNQVKNSLQLILYFDEFEVVNPLGSKRGIHKISAIYYSLANIYPFHRSELKTIQLCILCPTKVLKNVGFHKVLEPLLFDLNVLEIEGIQVLNIAERFFGTIAFVSGDNLGSHQIGGFSESFGSNVKSICRFCLASPDDIQKTFRSEQFLLRNKINYDLHVKETLEAPAGNVNLYGVKSNSVLNSLQYYHVTSGLPPDLMHDIFEGCARYEIPLFLQKFEKEKFFSKNEFIKIMKTWKYGANDTPNKPPAPKNLNSIPSSASQMWTLLRILPLMISKFIPEGNKTYEILLTLKEISEIVCAPRSNMRILSYLDCSISDHLELFSTEFPDQRLIPKQHFLIHYPQHIMNFGPLRSCWCMRFEGKHNYFKLLSHRLGNFKNICSTLASRHQRMQAYLTASDTKFFKNNQILSSSSVVCVKTLSLEVQEAFVRKNILDTEICHTNKILITGVIYQGGMYVVTNYKDIGEIELSKILGIYVQSQYFNSANLNSENVILLIEKQETSYNRHLSAFQMKNLKTLSLVSLAELVDYYPLDEYIVDGVRCATLKHIVCI